MAMDHNSAKTTGEPVVFRRVGEIETHMAVSVSVVEANVRRNIARDLPKLHHREDFGMWKGRPLAIVGGGPSLKTTLGDLREFSDVMVCGSAHDFIVDQGIIPTYAVACEPNNAPGDRVTDFIKKPRARTEYLFSTSCDPSVFDEMAAYNICMWNNAGGCDLGVFNGEPAVNGGCTVMLRAINIAILLGYHDMHMFGFDSSFEDETENHAYYSGPGDFVNWGNWLYAKIGDESGRQFKTTRSWLAQACQFQEMLQHTGYMFNPIIHGDGMIAEIMRQRRVAAAKQGVTE